MTAQLNREPFIRIGRAIGKEDQVRVRLDPLPFPFALLLAVGFALGVEVQIVGTLFAGEILLAIFAFFGAVINLWSHRFWTKDYYRFLGCLAISYMAYIMTDIVIGSPVTNLLRGWARMGFLLIDTAGLYVICRRNRFNLFPLILGLAVAMLIMPHQDTAQADFSVKWKFDLSFSWTSSVCILAAMMSRRHASLYAALGLSLVGVWSIFLDSRVVGAICIVVAVVICSQLMTSGRQKKLFTVMLALATAGGGVVTYTLVSRTNEQYGERREGSNVARASAILTALERIGRHPLLGTGSWNISQEHMDQHWANTKRLGGRHVATDMALGHSQVSSRRLKQASSARPFSSISFGD